MLFPWLSDHEQTHHKYALAIPGVTFQVLIGKSIPKNVRDCCLVHSARHLVFMSKAREEDLFRKMAELMAKTA